MIRSVGKKIKVMRYTEVEETITKEVIQSVLQLPNEKIVRVTLLLINEAGQEVEEKSVDIIGEDYSLLLSSSEVLGAYQQEELWEMIDKVENI